MSDDDDELERRKEDMWSMDEVRSGAGTASTTDSPDEDRSDTSVTSDTTDTSDIQDQSDSHVMSGASQTQEQSDREDMGETADTADTAEKNESGTSAVSDTEDTSDTIDSKEDESATSDTTDTSVTTDTETIADTEPQAVGSTVREMALDAEEKGLAVRDLHNVNVYLYESIHEEMISTFKRLDSEYYQAHGEDLSKNKDFFNAVFRAGLNSPQLREELDID
jgi:hypothetical protein